MKNLTVNKTHGSPYDRGRADSYYGRSRYPHKWPTGTGNGKMVVLISKKEIGDYLEGYNENCDFKDWGNVNNGHI